MKLDTGQLTKSKPRFEVQDGAKAEPQGAAKGGRAQFRILDVRPARENFRDGSEMKRIVHGRTHTGRSSVICQSIWMYAYSPLTASVPP